MANVYRPGQLPLMSMDDKTRLHFLRLKHLTGQGMDPHEYHELLKLEAQEYKERQESLKTAALVPTNLHFAR